ncbi:MAG: hypothetical protein IPL04_16195 [Chitinophagaceae bacterium]|nr:hypothetical protein [Chitinophagaceae bacterium]
MSTVNVSTPAIAIGCCNVTPVVPAPAVLLIVRLLIRLGVVVVNIPLF